MLHDPMICCYTKPRLMGTDVASRNASDGQSRAGHDVVLTWHQADDVQTPSDHGLTEPAGFAATCVGSPADVVGTRIMTDRSATQRGLVPYVVHMVRDEGVASLYKGFVPNFARIGRCCRACRVAGRASMTSSGY